MRDYLKEKTFIRFPGGECYEILGMIGEGGSGLIYSAGKVVRQGEDYVKENGRGWRMYTGSIFELLAQWTVEVE